MKKMLSVLLSLILVLSLTACGLGEGASGSGEDKKLRIAYGYGDWESALGIQMRTAFEYLAEAFDFEPVIFILGGGEDGLAAVESLLAGGNIDGIMSSASWDVARMLVADRHGVPVVTALQFPSDQEIASIAAFSNFLGGVTDNEFWAGYHTMKALYDAGARNVTWSGLTAGFSQGHDDRTRGAMQFIADHTEMNLLADSYTMGQWHTDVTTFAAIFPELEGMAFTSMNNGVYNVMEVEGIADGSVLIAGTDIASMTGEMFEREIQVWTAGGQYATTMIAFAVLWNYLTDEIRIIPDATEPIRRNYLEITSFEDYLEYSELSDPTIPFYSADDIRQLIHRYNPDVTIDDFIRLGEEFSLDDIKSRRAAN
jgi:ABC-type sugar transport system substrate-binding protein